MNTLLAVLIAVFGDQIGAPDLYLAAVIVIGARIFLNLSLIRRHVLGRPRETSSPSTMIFPLSTQEPRSDEPRVASVASASSLGEAPRA